MGQTKRLAILAAAASLMVATGATPLAGAQVTPDPDPTTMTTAPTTDDTSADTTTDTSQDTTSSEPAPETTTTAPETTPTDDSSTAPDDGSDDTTTTPPGDHAPDDSMSHDTPSDDDGTDTSGDSQGEVSAEGTQADADFAAYIAGTGEVPLTDSTAWAWAEFVVSDDGSELQWSARVFGLDNAVAAHLHMAPKGVNGPIVVPLEPPEEGSGPNDSADISGTITDDDLTGPLEGKTVADLIAAIEDGDIYLNIHTSDGQDGASNVPGDYPDGEIRGQLVTWPPQSSSPDDTSTTAPDDTSTTAPDDTSTTAPEDTSTTAPDDTSTTAPDDTSTTAPDDTSTTAPDDTSTTAPEDTSTTAPDDTSGSAPDQETTSTTAMMAGASTQH
jgi:hypothetical protein